MAFLSLVNFMEVYQMENQTWHIRLFACGERSWGIDHITIQHHCRNKNNAAIGYNDYTM